MSNRSWITLGFSRSASLQNINLEKQNNIKSQNQISSLNNGLYHLPSNILTQTPPPAYDASSSVDEINPNFNSTLQTISSQAQQNITPNSHGKHRGVHRPILPARSNSEFIPYSTCYYLIRSDHHHPNHQPLDDTQSFHHSTGKVSDQASIHLPTTVKRKTNKLRKPRPLPPNLVHQAKVNEVYRQPIHDHIKTPSNNERTNEANLVKGNLIRSEMVLSSLPQDSTTSSSGNRTSREFRDEKRLALINSKKQVAQTIPLDLNICLNCKSVYYNQNQLNIHINVDDNYHTSF